jgi:hypothetical protein
MPGYPAIQGRGCLGLSPLLSEGVIPGVVDGGGAGIGVARGDLHVAQGDSGVQGGHDERRPQHVWLDPVKPCLDTDRAHPAVGGAGVEAFTVVAQQDRSCAAFADRHIDRASRAWHERDARSLVARADDAQDAVTPFEPEVLDVSPARLTDPEAVQAEQHRQRGVHRRRPLGGVQERRQLAAVHAPAALWGGRGVGARTVLGSR